MTQRLLDLDPTLLLTPDTDESLLVELDDARDGRVLLFDDALFGENTCFACGRRLSARGAKTASADSAEHVIPRWMQKKFSLSNQQMMLLNGTTIRYSQLTIPLCTGCNNGPYSGMEQAVSEAVRMGAEAVRALHPSLLYAWLAKVFLGLLRKETLLPNSLRDPNGSRILAAEELDSFRLMHAFMQAPRVPMQFKFRSKVNGLPFKNPLGSVFIYKLQAQPAGSRPFFHLRDASNLRCIALALGEVGIIAALTDGGVVEASLPEQFELLEKHPLHPIQFMELCAEVFHRAWRVNWKPHYTIQPLRSEAGIYLPGVEVRMETFERRDPTLGSPLRQFLEEEYKAMLRLHTGMPDDVLFPKGDLASSLFTHDAGGKLSPKTLSLGTHSWPPVATPQPTGATVPYPLGTKEDDQSTGNR